MYMCSPLDIIVAAVCQPGTRNPTDTTAVSLSTSVSSLCFIRCRPSLNKYIKMTVAVLMSAAKMSSCCKETSCSTFTLHQREITVCVLLAYAIDTRGKSAVAGSTEA
jgi:hypothetical protein